MGAGHGGGAIEGKSLYIGAGGDERERSNLRELQIGGVFTDLESGAGAFEERIPCLLRR